MAQMARLRLRLHYAPAGTADGLGTSEGNTPLGAGRSSSGSRSARRHDLAKREIVGIKMQY